MCLLNNDTQNFSRLSFDSYLLLVYVNALNALNCIDNYNVYTSRIFFLTTLNHHANDEPILIDAIIHFGHDRQSVLAKGKSILFHLSHQIFFLFQYRHFFFPLLWVTVNKFDLTWFITTVLDHVYLEVKTLSLAIISTIFMTDTGNTFLLTVYMTILHAYILALSYKHETRFINHLYTGLIRYQKCSFLLTLINLLWLNHGHYNWLINK